MTTNIAGLCNQVTANFEEDNELAKWGRKNLAVIALLTNAKLPNGYPLHKAGEIEVSRTTYRRLLEIFHYQFIPVLEKAASGKVNKAAKEEAAKEGSLPGLFTLYSNSNYVNDNRRNSKRKRLRLTKGENNHTYLLLLCSVGHYGRMKHINNGLQKNKITILVSDLREFFANHGVDWQKGIQKPVSEKVWADNLCKYTREKLGFSRSELDTRQAGVAVHIIFTLP